MLNGCKYCYCCNRIQRARQERQELYASISTWSSCVPAIPQSKFPSPPTQSPSTSWYPCPCPLLAHSRRTTVLLSGSIMRGSTRWGRACSWSGAMGDEKGRGKRKSGFNVAGCLRRCASCNGPSCELFKCVESPAS